MSIYSSVKFCRLTISKFCIDRVKALDKFKSVAVNFSEKLLFLRAAEVSISVDDLRDLDLHDEGVDFSFGGSEGLIGMPLVLR